MPYCHRGANGCQSVAGMAWHGMESASGPHHFAGVIPCPDFTRLCRSRDRRPFLSWIRLKFALSDGPDRSSEMRAEDAIIPWAPAVPPSRAPSRHPRDTRRAVGGRAARFDAGMVAPIEPSPDSVPRVAETRVSWPCSACGPRGYCGGRDPVSERSAQRERVDNVPTLPHAGGGRHTATRYACLNTREIHSLPVWRPRHLRRGLRRFVGPSVPPTRDPRL